MSRTVLRPLDAKRLRRDFPALQQKVHGRPLVYLDNAATTQKPRQVIEAVSHYYEHDNSNVHRGVHLLSERATRAYEEARGKVRALLNAREASEVVFLRGTTEAINLAAWTHGRSVLTAGDEVLITHLEHHSNIVPWQMVCQATGARLRVAPILDDGSVDLEAFQGLCTPRTKVAAFAHISNALGTVNPVHEMTRIAHDAGATVLVDGAQALPHAPVDVQKIGCDLYAGSGHKMYGPTGIGFLYGRRDLLESMPPWQGGGDMISKVTFDHTEYNDVPFKFEAGTPNVAGAVGLGAAIDYLTEVGVDAVAAHEHALLEHALARLDEVPGLHHVGTAPGKAAVASFTLDNVHPHDVGSLLDHEGIAIRTGHHCAQPAMDRYGVAATCRASLALYNTREDVDALIAGLKKVVEVFT